MKEKSRLPVWIMILDSIGSIFLGLGAVSYFADLNIIPVALRSDGYGIKMMVIGGILYIPALIFILRKFTNRAPREI